MVSQLALKFRTRVGHAQHVDQEFGQFEGHLSQRFGPQPVGVQGRIFEERRVEVGDHAGAASAGHDDSIDEALFHEGFEYVQIAARQGACLVAITGIERRLPAAGLLVGEDYFDALPLQQFHRGHTDIGVEHVYHAGDEKGHALGRCRELFALSHGEK